jgi:hypothetical protein
MRAKARLQTTLNFFCEKIGKYSKNLHKKYYKAYHIFHACYKRHFCENKFII